MPKVAICTENVVIPAPGAGIVLKGERLVYAQAYFFQHLSVGFPQVMPPLPRNIAALDWNRLESSIMTQWVEGTWWIFEDRLPIVIYIGHSLLSPAKFERCIPSDMKLKETSISHTRSVA
jgi:hypothetical protein